MIAGECSLIAFTALIIGLGLGAAIGVIAMALADINRNEWSE